MKLTDNDRRRDILLHCDDWVLHLAVKWWVAGIFLAS